MELFLSTPSARRATLFQRRSGAVEEISIHALREEGDSAKKFGCTSGKDFYPRPPRGGRRDRRRPGYVKKHFYPRPPRGGRLDPNAVASVAMVFLSTPSARRATYRKFASSNFVIISIHALREEGDHPSRSIRGRLLYFYPRPPRGGRPDRKGSCWPLCDISIHALREEGDPASAGSCF